MAAFVSQQPPTLLPEVWRTEPALRVLYFSAQRSDLLFCRLSWESASRRGHTGPITLGSSTSRVRRLPLGDMPCIVSAEAPVHEIWQDMPGAA